jgi:two-component system response regulator QseB
MNTGSRSPETARTRLLLVDDDRELRAMLVGVLRDEGYEVTEAEDGHSAMREALTGDFCVAILDRGLPFLDGLELLTRLRQSGWFVPVLVLSAYGTAPDRVAGLDAGAEDYLVKPFDLDELLARVRSLQRRHTDEVPTLAVVGGRFEVRERRVRLDGRAEPVELSVREAGLLELLARRPSQVFPRDVLQERVFADTESDSIVDTYVHYLRRKLGKAVIRTVHGVGYQAGTPSDPRGAE